MTPLPYRYTVEGELLTKAEIVARVKALAPTLKPDTVRRRVDSGARTWALLTQLPIDGAKLRRDKLKRAISNTFRKRE